MSESNSSNLSQTEIEKRKRLSKMIKKKKRKGRETTYKKNGKRIR